MPDIGRIHGVLLPQVAFYTGNNEHFEILLEIYMFRNLISLHFSAAGCVGWSVVSHEIANFLYAT